jgi:hypothetical protein
MHHRPETHRSFTPDASPWLSLLGVLAVMTMASGAIAAGLPRLVVTRSAEAADCPDAATLALVVEKQMQRPGLDPSADGSDIASYEVTMDRSSNGYTAIIRSGDLTRELSDPASTCSELADALALMLTIMLDSEPVVLPAKPPETAAPPKPLPPPPAIPIRVVSPTVRQWSAGLAGTLGESIGFLTPLSFVIAPEGWFRYRSATFGAGAFLIPWSTAGDESSFAVRMQLFTGNLHGCGRIAGKQTGLHFDLCGQTFLGAVRGEGMGFVVNRGSSRPWFGLGALGMLEGPMFRRLDWSLRLGLTFPVVSQRFAGTRPEGTNSNPPEALITLFEPSKIAVFLAFGVRWTIL